MKRLSRAIFFCSLALSATAAFAADGAGPARDAFLYCGVGGFVLTLGIPLMLALVRKASQSDPTIEDLAALREARLRAHRESAALQETLDREARSAR